MAETPILVLIPAYKPDERLVALCEELRGESLDVLVIDDGSGADCRPFFESVAALGCAVERHAVNLGKGRALKTGINAAMNRCPTCMGLVTADADGQHTLADILRVIGAMREEPRALVIGARRFTGNVPFKSRAGNAITRFVYHLVTGIRCRDTQTGLRGIPAEALGAMLRLPGERYEFEMTMLLKLKDLDLPLREVDIETIYIDDNKGSHFSPLRDAARIYSVILRFMLVSIVSFCLDYALYLLGLAVLPFPDGVCYAIARVISSVFNFAVNRSAVFGGRGGKMAIVRYYLLAVVLLAVGSLLVEALQGMLGLGSAWVKLPVDVALFFVSFAVQRDFVFQDRKPKETGKQP